MKPPRHMKIIWSGVLGTRAAPVEIFSHHLSVRVPEATWNAPDADKKIILQEIAQACGPLVAPRLTSRVTQSVHWTRCRAVLVGADGKYVRDGSGAYLKYDHPLTTQSGSHPSGVPFQIALAVTLKTAASGRTGRGRFYLPCPITEVNPTTGLQLAALVTDAETQCQAFVGEVEVATELAMGAEGDVVLASGGSAKEGIAPALRPLTNVTVGNVLDTVRSRRGALQETYTG